MRLAILSLLAVLGAGFASPWQSNFAPNPDLEGRKFPATDSVQIRTVEFERLQHYRESEHQLRVASTTAPEDLPADEQRAAKNRLLEALQMKERGDEIEVLGFSQFVSSERLDPNNNDLVTFAKQIGADCVVFSSFFAGKTVSTVDRPYTSYSYITSTGGHHRRGGFVTASSTTWVPVNVVEDQLFYSAAFLRKSRT